MTALLPGYKEQLGARATSLAAEHERRGRPEAVTGGAGAARRRRGGRFGHHLGITVLIGGALAGGVAYASQGLWSPVMGDDNRGRPTANDSPLPPELLERYAVLRREQTEADRGPGSRDALRWQSRGVIQTNAVRRLGTGYEKTAIVLIPLARKHGAPGDPTTTRTLCLWQQDPKEAGGMACSPVDRAIREGVMMYSAEPPKLSKADRRRVAAAFRAAQRRQSRDGRGKFVRLPMRLVAGGKAHIVGLVPDGVAQVRIGEGTHAVTVPVKNNVYLADRPEQYLQPLVWLDGGGKAVGPPEPSR